MTEIIKKIKEILAENNFCGYHDLICNNDISCFDCENKYKLEKIKKLIEEA